MSFQFQVDPGKHNMFKKLGFITNEPRWSTFNDKIGKKKKTPFNLHVRVRYRDNSCFCFSVFGDRDGDSIAGIKREKVVDLIW